MSIPPAAASVPPPSRVHRSIPAPPPSRAMLPMPAIEPMLDKADEARQKRDFELALEEYKKALMVVDPSDSHTCASLYANIAEVKRAQGKRREAELNYEKALSAMATHRRSLEALVELAEKDDELERIVTYRRRLAYAIEEPEARSQELCRLAAAQLKSGGDYELAAESLERAFELRPKHASTLKQLAELYRDKKQHKKLIDVYDRLTDLTDDDRERARYRFSQADVMLTKLWDEPRALAFMELALMDDPSHEKALVTMTAVRTRREEWGELARVYERVVVELARAKKAEEAFFVCKKLAVLRRDRLFDGPGAVEAFRAALEIHPEDVEARSALAELYVAKGERHAAVRELETMAWFEPRRAQTYRRLFELHMRASRPDRALHAAECLEELGATEMDHELYLQQLRPTSPIRPTAPLSEADLVKIRPHGSDDILEEILGIVKDVAVQHRVDVLGREQKLSITHEQKKLDPEGTGSAARTFAWAGKVLGIDLPDLVVMDDDRTSVAAMRAAAPSVAVGPSVLTGRSVMELAFLAGRHLVYYRPEHYALIFYPTLADLTALVLGAISVVHPDLGKPTAIRAEMEALFNKLSAKLSEQAKAQLKAAVEKLDARGGKMELLTWMKSVELLATRCGFLLASDLRVATKIIRAEERAIAELSAEDRRSDLLAFAVSGTYAEVREKLGVSLHPSITMPPPRPTEPDVGAPR
jgi:tetratricopeptide (TPR) repeat protein